MRSAGPRREREFCCRWSVRVAAPYADTVRVRPYRGACAGPIVDRCRSRSNIQAAYDRQGMLALAFCHRVTADAKQGICSARSSQTYDSERMSISGSGPFRGQHRGGRKFSRSRVVRVSSKDGRKSVLKQMHVATRQSDVTIF